MTQVIEKIGGEYENRTHVHGFAIRCVTTPPTRRSSHSINRSLRGCKCERLKMQRLICARYVSCGTRFTC